MKSQFVLKNGLAAAALLFSLNLFAHEHHDAPANLKKWTISTENRPFEASFLMSRNDTVYLENANGLIAGFPLDDFSGEDQNFILGKMAAIKQMNHPIHANHYADAGEHPYLLRNRDMMLGIVLLVFTSLAAFLFLKSNRKWSFAALLGGAAIFGSFQTKTVQNMLGTDPLFMEAAFAPFKPHIATRWDNNWFYVESNGLPTTHLMMKGITKWQQQVPIPQCYVGANAWQIPLNPVLAATPVPVNQQHFLRGAVAIAANGIPIFNPYTNTGVDAFLDGQLDQWGGHSGRADDYHYHIAPMFLDTQTVDILPIAFALDGFAVYADHEPDGSAMLPLDANHGHFDKAGVYHYHGTPNAPYMIGNMVGQVTEDATLQIIPQARAKPVRPSLTPLNGAVLTDFQPNATGNGYILTYTKDGQTYKVDYNWTSSGVYTYRFISPAGTTTETYNGDAPCTTLVSTDDHSGKNTEVTVFPNPTNGSVFLKLGLENPEMANIQIYEANGRLVFQKEKAGAVLEISGLAKGIYVMIIQIEKAEICRKIIIQ